MWRFRVINWWWWRACQVLVSLLWPLIPSMLRGNVAMWKVSQPMLASFWEIWRNLMWTRLMVWVLPSPLTRKQQAKTLVRRSTTTSILCILDLDNSGTSVTSKSHHLHEHEHNRPSAHDQKRPCVALFYDEQLALKSAYAYAQEELEPRPQSVLQRMTE